MKTSMAAPKPSEYEHPSQDQDAGHNSGDRLDHRRDRPAARLFIQRDLRISDAEERSSEEGNCGDRGEDERDAGKDEYRRERPPKPVARDDRGVRPASRRAHPAKSREGSRCQIGRQKAGT